MLPIAVRVDDVETAHEAGDGESDLGADGESMAAELLLQEPVHRRPVLTFPPDQEGDPVPPRRIGPPP
ncbi:MAG: hypothetical protein MZV64_09725 [Ignavibacteriales bacterium]|nr:hypothetical protein [Ignavibacteriales bacterium]